MRVRSCHFGVLRIKSQIDAHADIVAVVTTALVEGYQLGPAIEDDLVAAQPCGFLGRMLHQQAADSTVLKIPVHGHIFNMAHVAALMDKLLFDEKAERTNDPVASERDIRANAGAEPAPEDFRGLADGELNVSQAGQRFQQVIVDVMPRQLADHNIHGRISHRAR
jgi:hypothetical protein